MKMVNFWKTLFFTVLTVAAFTGCSKDNSDDGGLVMPSISVNGEETQVGAVDFDGGDLSFTVASTGNWTLKLDDESASSWCSVATSGGSGTTTLTFHVSAWSGAQAGDNRSVTATLVTEGKIYGQSSYDNAYIVIRQNADASLFPKTNVAEIRALLEAMNPSSSLTAVTTDIAAKTITVPRCAI